MTTFSSFKHPARFAVMCAVIGKAEDGEDYIHRLGNYPTIEKATAAIEADRRYWAGDTSLGGLVPRDGGERRYRIFEAEWSEIA